MQTTITTTEHYDLKTIGEMLIAEGHDVVSVTGTLLYMVSKPSVMLLMKGVTDDGHQVCKAIVYDEPEGKFLYAVSIPFNR